MRIRLRETRQGAGHGSCCQCHSPVVFRFNQRIARDISRRSVLGGATTLFTASSLPKSPTSQARDVNHPRLFRNAPLYDGRSSDLQARFDVLVSGNAIQDLVPVVIDGNPLQDISLVADPERNMKLIMKDGVVYKDDLQGSCESEAYGTGGSQAIRGRLGASRSRGAEY